jgi:hypothetical protein
MLVIVWLPPSQIEFGTCVIDVAKSRLEPLRLTIRVFPKATLRVDYNSFHKGNMRSLRKHRAPVALRSAAFP